MGDDWGDDAGWAEGDDAGGDLLGLEGDLRYMEVKLNH